MAIVNIFLTLFRLKQLLPRRCNYTDTLLFPGEKISRLVVQILQCARILHWHGEYLGSCVSLGMLRPSLGLNATCERYKLFFLGISMLFPPCPAMILVTYVGSLGWIYLPSTYMTSGFRSAGRG